MGSSWAEKVLFGCLAENVAGNNDKFLFRVLCLVQSADLSAGESGAGKVTRHADGDFASAHSRTEPVVVCIAGMHRSGTSMVASLIHSCGVYVGPESDIKVSSPDNERGHWEYGDFVQLNDALLEKLGGTWDAPPSPPTNWDGDDLAPLRERAIDLIGRLSSLKRWGWKDPRNSLTLPFWRHLIPRLKVVICLRNPLEVIQSLAKRGSPGDESLLELWQSYNHSLMAAIPAGDRLITHYSAYFPDARHELRRVLDFLGITASNETIERACETVAEELRHHRLGNQGLKEAGVPNDVAMQYLEMCAEAGPVYQQTQRNLTQRDKSVGAYYKDILRVLRLEAEVKDKENLLQVRESELASFKAEAEAQVARLEERLSEKQTELDKKQIELDANKVELDRKQTELGEKQAELDRITNTMGWRLLSRYGKFKHRFLLPIYRLFHTGSANRK